MRAYYTAPDHSTGFLEFDDGSCCFGPIPPKDGPARSKYEAFLAKGGVVSAWTLAEAQDPAP